MKSFYSTLAAGALTLALIAPTAAFASTTAPTTDAATGISQTDATLNGTNGDTDATGHSFWVSTSTYTVSGTTLPSGVHDSGDLGPVTAATAFSVQLSSILGAPVTPGTTYYFNAWANGGGWENGSVMSFMTTAAPVSHAVVYVDANSGNDSNDGASAGTAFLTINHALSVVDAGGTVHVAAGTYNEHVVVGKAVTLDGANAGTAGNASRAAESIVDGSQTDATFAVNANDVTIDGFTIQGGANGLNAGVATNGYSGLKVINDVITNNTIGIYPQATTNALIEHDFFDGNNIPGPSGGAAIYVEAATGLTIQNNEFKNHTENNPVLFAATAPNAYTNLTFSGNNLHDNSYGVYVLAVNGGTFSGNTIVLSGAVTALAFASNDANITVTGNTISGSARGIRVDDDGYGYGNNSSITVHHNSLTGNSQYGLAVNGGYTGTLDATENWWGAASGPLATTTPMTNPSGTGSPVVGNVSYSPWYTDAAMTVFSTPTLVLNGNNPMTVIAGAPFVDPLATATDSGTGTTTQVTGTGTVDTFTLGSYPVTYNFTDSHGRVAPSVTRTVNVVSANAPGGGGSSSSSSGGSSSSNTTTTITGTGQVLGASTFNFSADLTVGATGDGVIALQQLLIDLGYLHIAAPTGYFGPLTQAAVKLYQLAHGLPATGYVGPLTRAALNIGSIPNGSREQALQNLRNALPGILAAIQHIQAELTALIAAGAIQ